MQAAAGELRACETFDELYRLVTEKIGGIQSMGVLTNYDVATRIGAHLDLAPDRVYLHAGTARGASAVLRINGREAISRFELPAAFRRLRSYEAEDCLCIFWRDLHQLVERP